MSEELEIHEEELQPLEVFDLPLGDWHRAKGARMVEFAGYHMPIQYEGIMAEHAWTRENAGLFDVSHMGQLILSGEGVAAALEKIVPGDISALAEERMRYSLLLAEDGGILDDLMITATPMGLYLVVNGAVKWDDMAYLRGELPDEITINQLEDRALIALQGPKAADALGRVVPNVGSLFFMEAGSFFWQHEPLWISRSGYTGEDGFEISIPAELAVAFADALCAQPEVKPIGLGARDSLRLEAGLPLYGHDLDPAIDPVQGDLSFAISKRRRAEGGFAGSERIMAGSYPRPGQKAGWFQRRWQDTGARRRCNLCRRRASRRNNVGRFRPHSRRADCNGFCCHGSFRSWHTIRGRSSRQTDRLDSYRNAICPPSLSPERKTRMSRYFTEDHEWIEVAGDIATIGITDYAQGQLGDIVFAEVPAVGASLIKGGDAAVVELVKAASDVYAPVSGNVTEGNIALEEDPALINSDPEGEGWFFKLQLSDPAELDSLMDADAYQAFVDAL